MALLEECYQVALDLAKKGGAIAQDALHREKKVDAKISSADLVTESDMKVEKMILSELKQKFPTHKFIAEETVAEDGCCKLTDEPTWIIDPIDGTSNFIHTFPFSAISIGFAMNKKPVVGVVYNFILDRMYAAKEGGGATLNGKPIHVSQCTEIKDAFLLTEFGNYRPDKILKAKVETMVSIVSEPNQVCGIRSTGSAALSMCLVACGSADAYLEYGIHCWDIAAGDVILREAGGISLYPTGAPLNVMKRGVLCGSTEQLLKQLLPHIKHIDYPPDEAD